MVFTQIWYLHTQALQDQNKGFTNCAEFTLQWRNYPIWRYIVNIKKYFFSSYEHQCTSCKSFRKALKFFYYFKHFKF